MITWCAKLYCDSYMEKRAAKMKRRLERGKVTLACYCIALPSNRENLLDIICANELLFDYYRQQNRVILGLALGRDSAVEVARRIVEDVCRETGGFDIESFLMGREE